MNFLYNTVPGRIILNILLNARVLKILSAWLHSPSSRILIGRFIKKHHIDMAEFEGQRYRSYADFFARKKKIVLPESGENELISPCDGLFSLYPIEEGSRFVVKGIPCRLDELIPDQKTARLFEDGLCLIFRLQATDYHHYCYIDDCYHERGHLIPGKLHSVQPIALEKVPVFRQNKRYWSLLRTKHFGTVAQVEVGAVLVGDIIHDAEERQVRRGDEMGRFELCGSTIILLVTKEVRDTLVIDTNIRRRLAAEMEYPVKLGQPVGKLG